LGNVEKKRIVPYPSWTSCSRWSTVSAVPAEEKRMPDNDKAFDRKTREFSMERALAILEELRAAKTGRRRVG
jgi:hypothetical protein